MFLSYDLYHSEIIKPETIIFNNIVKFDNTYNFTMYKSSPKQYTDSPLISDSC